MSSKTPPASAKSSDAPTFKNIGRPASSAGPTAPARLPRWFRHAVRVLLQIGLDAAAVASAYRAAYEIRFHWGWWLRHFPLTGGDPGWQLYTRMLFALVPLWLWIFWYAAHLYTQPWQRTSDRFLFILKGALLGALATLSASYIYDRIAFSREMLLGAIPIVVAFVTLSETLVLSLDGWIARFEATSPLLLIGGGKVTELIRENLKARHPGLTIFEFERFAGVEKTMAAALRAGVSEIIMVRPAQGQAGILDLAEACESAGVSFKMIPDLLELRLGEVQMDDSLGLPAYRIQHTSLSPINRAVKRVFDLALCAVVFAMTAVPLAIMALLIKLDSEGPVLYKQKRFGYKSKVFEAFKFRTMIAGAETKVDQVKKTANDQKGGFFKSKDDPRVTRVGRFLRRYSLDEFPQFLNVLRGEMSVIGPRPLAVMTGEFEEILREFGPTAKKRMNILPGITGLWQVSGRSDLSSEQRFALDLFYIEHWSLGLDLQILLKTVPVMLAGKGAY